MPRVNDTDGWRGPVVTIVLVVTGLRVLALALNQTDLFVDESQYWLWGQTLDFGYYSKPPLIAWVIRAVTWLAGSDAPFWVRLPAPLFHGVTALVLAAAGARLGGRVSAVWVAATYATLPFTAVGSALISTDTIMAPFFAGALYFHLRLVETRRVRFALLTGASIGIGFLAKYAAVYALGGVALAAIFWPVARIGWRNGFWLSLAFLVAIAPNVIWNLSHKLATVQHTLDNVGWVRGGADGPSVNPASLLEFLAVQLGVFGPLTFVALVAGLAQWRPAKGAWLPGFVLLALLIVAGQALLAKAYANWAVSAYFAGTLIVVPFLLARAPRVLWWSLAVNSTLCVAVAVLTVMAPDLTFGRQTPLLARYLGRAALSDQIIAAAAGKATVIVAADRDILADLFYTGRRSGLTFRALPYAGRPRNYYEQTYALALDATGNVFAVLASAPVCGGVAVTPEVTFNTAGGAFRRVTLAAYVIGADCARSLD